MGCYCYAEYLVVYMTKMVTLEKAELSDELYVSASAVNPRVTEYPVCQARVGRKEPGIRSVPSHWRRYATPSSDKLILCPVEGQHSIKVGSKADQVVVQAL